MRNGQLKYLLLWIGVLFVSLVLSAHAADPSPDGEPLTAGVQDVTDVPLGPYYQIHENPYFRATVTNWGFFGDYGPDLIDSSSLGTPDTLQAPGFETPVHSQVGYLWQAGLWVGGIVGNDTLVSVGVQGWPSSTEYHADFGAPPVYSDTLGDEEFTSVYTDTLTDPTIVKPDIIDGNHRPFPIKVRQTTRLVSDPRFDRGMIVEVTVTNLGTQTINDLWLGWYVDCDVWHPGNINSWRGDLSGHRESPVTLDGKTYAISAAWSADNSGDPDSTGVFNERSCLGVFGSMFLESNPPLPEVSFNWWNIGFSKSYDWGPSRNPSDTNIYGGYGRLTGDAMRYRYMSNREIDYDQVYAARDFSSEGWIPPTIASVAQDLANGYDTRFLDTRGGVDLAPGDSVIAAWTWVMAPGLHTNPLNYADNFDWAAPETYLAGLNFLHLDTALARMRQLWDSRFASAAVGPPKNFRITAWDDSSASMAWLPRSTYRLGMYEIFRTFDSTRFNSPAVGSISPGQSSFTQSGLPRLPVQYYVIRSRDHKGVSGIASPIVDVLPDRPQEPVLSGAVRGDGEIRILWEAPTEPDVVSHRVFRRAAGGAWGFIGETYLPGAMTDNSANNATPYEYRITAMSKLGSESFYSEPVRGVAFSFDGAPLVIDYTLSGGTSLTIKDSVAAVWKRMTAPLGSMYRNADPVTTLPFGLDVYNAHPAVVIVSDGRQGPRPNWTGQISAYAYAGGVTFLSGRDLFNKDVIAEGTLTFGPGDPAYDYFGITSAYYPRVLLSHPTRPNAEFIAARSHDAVLPDLMVDSTRTNWGLSPVLPKPGAAVPFVGFYDVDTSRATVLYSYVSRDSSVSFSHGRAVAVISKVPGVHALALSFPLSYVDETAATSVVNALMRRMGWVADLPGDCDGDGFVTVLDLSLMIDYAFADGVLTNVSNADVNADCVVNLIDVVILIDYLFKGGTTLSPGCALP